MFSPCPFFFFLFFYCWQTAEGHLIFLLQSKQKFYSSNLQVLTQQEIPVSPRNSTEGYSIFMRSPSIHVWAGSGTPTAEKCVDALKFCTGLLWRATLCWISLSLLQPAHTYGRASTSFRRRASEGIQEAQSRQQIIMCMISRAIEPHFLHICPFKPQNKDKVSDFKF